jgi:hypothetical protein
MKSAFLVLLTLFVAHVCLGQSKPLDLSITLSDLNNYQALADKGQANGYTPLNSNSLVPPSFLFPGFSSSQDGTIWSKSGSSWLAISNLTIQPFSLVVSLTRVGKLSIPGVSLDIYGVGTELSTVPLTLYGGNNRVYVANGQSIGGANVNFNNFTWSINSSGNFDLNSGIIKGGMSLNNTSISNISSIFSSNGLSINFTNNRITSLQSGKDVIFAGDDFGVQVPNIQTNKLLNPLTSETTRNYALNVRSADLLYVAKNSSNNWTLPQRFTGGISISPALSISNGGTGATNAQQARQNLGITTGVTGGFQAWSTVLTSLASNIPTTNNFLVGISSAWVSRTPAQVRSILGVEIGSGGLQPYSATLNYISTIVTNNSLGSKYIFVGDPVTQTLTARTAAFARSDLGLEINSTNGVQAYSPYLRDIANLGIPQLDEFLVGTGTAWTKKTPSQARISLGLGATWLTNTNVTNFRTAIGLGTTDEVSFSTVTSTYVATVDGLNGTALAPTGIQFNGVAAAITRTNLGLGATWLTNTNVTNFRTAIELGSAATNNASAFQPASANLTNLASNNAANLTNFPTLNQNTTGTASNVTGVVALTNGGTGTNSAEGARSNLGLGATNAVTFSNITASGTLAVSNTATFSTNVTVTGNATLNGSGNLAPSQTASSGSSLMTRALTDNNSLWNVSSVRPLGAYAFDGANGGSGGPAHAFGGASIGPGTNANGFGRARLYYGLNNNSPLIGTGIGMYQSIAVAAVIAMRGEDVAEGNVVRLIVGSPDTVAPANSNAITTAGFGVEFTRSTTNTNAWPAATTKARLFAHDGTTYRTSSYTPDFRGEFASQVAFVVAKTTAGVVTLHMDTSILSHGVAPQRVPLAPVLTITNGPSGGNGAQSVDFITANTSTNAHAVPNVAFFYNGMVEIKD